MLQLPKIPKQQQPLTEWISHVLGPVGVWALTGHVALHSKALQGESKQNNTMLVIETHWDMAQVVVASRLEMTEL
jgi:hypothetical protein